MTRSQNSLNLYQLFHLFLLTHTVMPSSHSSCTRIFFQLLTLIEIQRRLNGDWKDNDRNYFAELACCSPSLPTEVLRILFNFIIIAEEKSKVVIETRPPPKLEEFS